jgi:uncharacterized protein YjbI with pentapeptide repeats
VPWTQLRIEEAGTKAALLRTILALVFTFAVTTALALALPGAATAATGADPPEARTTPLQALEEDLLRAEVRALNDEHDAPWWERSAAVGIIGAFVGAAGLLWTITQQRREMARQSNADRERASHDEQARLDGLFAGLATHISSQDVAVRLSALAGIESFATPKRRAYHRQLLSLLQGMVKISRGDVTDRIIARAFVNFLSLQQLRGKAPDGPLDLEMACLEGCSLARLDLRGADLRRATLREVVIHESVNLSGADCKGLSAQRLSAAGAQLAQAKLDQSTLQEAQLKDADLRNVTFHKANLVSADLRGARLNDARLREAKLQSAHFEGADLSGARLDGADLRDAYFHGATLDPPAIRSILRCSEWRRAHWDPEQIEALGPS